jgi:iron complex outermembrane recepter protein
MASLCFRKEVDESQAALHKRWSRRRQASLKWHHGKHMEFRCGWASLLLLASGALCAQSVVVTGTLSPVPLEEVDRSVRLLPVNPEIRLTSNSWIDLLRLDPSLNLQQRSPHGVLSDVSIRGGSFGQTLVLLNGLRLNDPQTGHFHMNLPVSLDVVERIEVLKGAGSLFYGSDAVGGVINVITGVPEAGSVRVRTAYGSFGTQQQRVDLGWNKGSWSQLLNVSRDFSTGFRPNRDYRNLSLASESHLRTRLGNSSVLLAHADRPFGAENFYGNAPSWERTKTWWASLRQELGDRTEVALAYRRGSDLFVLYRYEPERYTNRHIGESFHGAVRRQDPLGTSLRIQYGVEGFRDELDSNNLGQRSRDRGAAYISLDARAMRRFSFTIGARKEIYTNGGRQFNPTFAGAYWLSSQWKLKASVSRAFRLPTFTDLYYQDRFNLGNDQLRPERAWSYEGGIEWLPTENLRGEATVFQRRDSDGIDYVRRSDLDPWRATNFQRLRFTGAELGLTWRVRRYHLLSAHHTTLRGAQEALAGLQSKYVFNYPTENTVLGWQGPLPLELIGRVRVGRMDRIARQPFTTVDVYLARKPARISPFVQWTNLSGARYEEIPGVPMPGRAVLGGIELRLRP